MASVVEILFIGKAAFGDAKREVKDMGKSIDELHEKGKRGGVGGLLGGLAKTGALAAGAAALGGFTGSVGAGVDAFAKWQDANTRMNQALKDTGQSIPQDKLDTLEASMRKLGITDTDTESSIASLVMAGVSSGDAMKYQSTIADLAAAKHMSLADATEAVTKAANGRMSPALKELGINLKKGETGTAALSDMMGQLGPKVGGQATAHAHTFSGALDVMKASLDHVFVAIGEKVAPMLQKLAGWFSDHSQQIGNFVSSVLDGMGTALTVIGNVIGFVMDHMEVFGPVLAGVVGSFVAWKAILAGQWLLNFFSGIAAGIAQILGLSAAEDAAAASGEAMDTALNSNPIGAIAMAIGLLVAGIVLLVTHLHQVGQFFGAVFGAMKAVVTDVVNFIKEHWQLLLAIFLGPLGIVVGFVVSHFQQIKNIAVGVFNDIKAVISDVTGFFGRAFQIAADAVGAVFHGITTTISNVWNGLVALIKVPINGIIGGLDWLIDKINGIQIHISVGPVKFDWDGLNLPKIPKLAAGATLNGATLAVLGEAGKEHAVPDLAMNELLQRAAEYGAGANGSGGTNVVVNNPHSDVDVITAMERQRWLDRMSQRGIGAGANWPMGAMT